MGSELDYATMYKDVDRSHGPAWSLDPHCMIKQRLYLSLDSVSKISEDKAKLITKLVVFADVVDVEEESIKLPGCKEVYIMCRLLRIKTHNGKLCTISCPYANRSVIDADITHEVCTYTASKDCGKFKLFIFAQSVVMEHMAITVPFKLHCSKPIVDTPNPEVDVQWLIPSEESPIVQTHGKLFVLDYGNLCDGYVDFSNAQSHFRVISPETPPHSMMSDVYVMTCIGFSLKAMDIIPKFYCQSPNVETAAKAHLDWLITHLSAAGDDSSLQDLLSRAKALRQLQTSSIASADMVPYAEVYANVEQATKAVATSECSEVMTVQRMYFLLDDLDTAPLKDASVVKELMIYADVVELSRTSTSVDGEVLGALLFRVQALMKLPLSYEVVPSLEYTTYQVLIDNLARAAEAYNNEFNRVDLFIRQNQILGSYLVEENKALAEKEKDMEELHNNLVKRKQDELATTIKKVDHLQIQMKEQKGAMDKAKTDMDEGLKEYQEEQIAKAFFAVLSAIGECVLAFATDGATGGEAAKGVEKAAEAIKQAEKAVTLLEKLKDTFKKLMNVLKKVQKVVEVVIAIKDLIEKIVDITKMVDAPPMPDLPTNADWEIFVNEVENVAETMPKEVSEVATWKCKCKNLAAVCREIITTVVYMQQLEYDLLVESLQAKVAAKHAKRLQEIQPADVKNYLEMASQINMRTTRILLNLLKLFKLQRGALLYHYLLPLKPFTGWMTIETVRNALVQNAADAVTAMQLLGPSNYFEREYLVCDIPVDLLRQGQDWTFTIPIDDYVNFPPAWCRVRIQHVEITFSSGHHHPSTKTGEVYFLLQASRTFQDRGQSGDVLNYEAGVPLYYQYASSLTSGKTTVSNKPTHEDEGLYMRLTPFTQWRLRLSASAYENQGLSFPTAKANDPSETTQITITFHLTAIRTVSF